MMAFPESSSAWMENLAGALPWTVSDSAGGADIVVRIELVGAAEAHAAAEDDAAQAAACQLLRRGRPIRGSVGARPADVQRGASAGQGAEQERSTHPRHAAELQAVSA